MEEDPWYSTVTKGTVVVRVLMASPAFNLVLFYRRLRKFLSRPEFKGKRVRVILYRLWWELRWRILRGHPPRAKIENVAWLQLVRTPPCFSLYAVGFYEREVGEFIRYYLRPGMVFADLGAYIGEHTVRAAQLVEGSGRVYAFEPNPSMFQMLVRNISDNGLRNVVLEQLAISDCCGDVIYENRCYPEGSGLERDASNLQIDSLNPVVNTTRATATTLDDYVQQHCLSSVNLIKVDVEGAELKVFRGAKRILSSCSPALIFEFSTVLCATYKYAPEEILSLLREQGYSVYKPRFDGQGLFLADFVFHGGCDIHVNLVALKDADLVFQTLYRRA